MELMNKIQTIIKQYDNIIIMTHKNPDLDGFASTLCMQQILSQQEKKSYIFLGDSKTDSSIEKTKQTIEKYDLSYTFIKQKEVKEKENKLLIILDVNKAEMLENPTILEEIENCIIIDHHLQGQDYIQNTKLTYIDTKASSVAEIMIELLMENNQTIDKYLATFLLAGMDIDTNSFNVKTTEKTFLTASYLMKNQADNVLKLELLKENKENHIKKQFFIRKSFMLTDKIALCTLDDNIYENKFLATISEELLQFDNVEGSFTIGKIAKNKIGISGRSMGNIDIQKIISVLGGGGHKTNAAAQIENTTISEVKEKLKEVIGGKQ